MIIGGIDVGNRNRPAVSLPTRWAAGSISLAGTTQNRDLGVTEYEVPITLLMRSETIKNGLRIIWSKSVRPWGSASITADAGDDLGFGATGAASATTVTFINMQSEYQAPDRWNININFKKFGT